MRSFWYEFWGDRIEIVFSLVKNGRWRYSGTEKIGIEFEYLNYLHDDGIFIDTSDLEDLDPEVRSMLLQSLKMDAPDFNLSYS